MAPCTDGQVTSLGEQIWGLKVKGQGHYKQKCKKIVFRAYLRQNWIDLRQSKTKMINGLFYTRIIEYISPAEMLKCFVFCDNL